MVGLAAGVGYIAKKMLKENFLGDPSTVVMNYGEMDCDSGWINGLKNLS